MQGPYRPQAPTPDPELARLALEGGQRRHELAAATANAVHAAHGRHLRTAIGAFRGSALKRVFVGGIVVCLLVAAAGTALTALGEQEIGAPLSTAFVGAFASFMIWVFVPPLATRATVAAEQAWVSALPFPVNGYFELLGAEPAPSCSVTYEIAWQEGVPPPDPALLHGIFGAVDPAAQLQTAAGGRATTTDGAVRFRGGPVSGSTGIRVNRVPVFRNHRLPASIHAVIEKVLLPLHRSHPIAHVMLARS